MGMTPRRGLEVRVQRFFGACFKLELDQAPSKSRGRLRPTLLGKTIGLELDVKGFSIRQVGVLTTKAVIRPIFHKLIN